MLPKAKAGPSRLVESAVGVRVSRTRGNDTSIPSSAPAQDHRAPTPPRPPFPPRTGSRRKGNKSEATRAFIPETSPTRVTPTLDDDITEPADDLPMEAMDTVDDVPPPWDSKVPSNHKGLAPVALRTATYKSVPRATSKTPSIATTARALKRNNYHPMATRVFALWKQAAAYFSGIVYERVKQSDRFKINFDDGDEDVIDVKNLRRLELRVGDRVSIIESQEKATIANVDRQQRGFVTVQLVDDPTTEFEVEVLGIKIQSRAVGSQWGDRAINTDEIVTLMSTLKTETPTSLRNSSSNLNKKKVLTKVGIVVTMSVGSDREKERELTMRIIKANGGTVLDDWSDIVALAGEHSANKKRWVITSDNIAMEMKFDIQQVFLVSDAANTKPRFLTALALGIPCLSVEWLRHLSSGVSFIAGSD
jgi:DNA repair protein Crb2 Tudor domain/BRCA1 C Terminus (BRCT) domain